MKLKTTPNKKSYPRNFIVLLILLGSILSKSIPLSDTESKKQQLKSEIEAILSKMNAIKVQKVQIIQKNQLPVTNLQQAESPSKLATKLQYLTQQEDSLNQDLHTLVSEYQSPNSHHIPPTNQTGKPLIPNIDKETQLSLLKKAEEIYKRRMSILQMVKNIPQSQIASKQEEITRQFQKIKEGIMSGKIDKIPDLPYTIPLPINITNPQSLEESKNYLKESLIKFWKERDPNFNPSNMTQSQKGGISCFSDLSDQFYLHKKDLQVKNYDWLVIPGSCQSIMDNIGFDKTQCLDYFKNEFQKLNKLKKEKDTSPSNLQKSLLQLQINLEKFSIIKGAEEKCKIKSLTKKCKKTLEYKLLQIYSSIGSTNPSNIVNNVLEKVTLQPKIVLEIYKDCSSSFK